MTTPVLKQSHGPEFTRILAVGAARGDLVVSNDDLVGPIDSSDEWIRQRTGIIELAPAGALVGLAKRGLKGVPTVAVKTPDDLAAAFALIDGTA